MTNKTIYNTHVIIYIYHTFIILSFFICQFDVNRVDIHNFGILLYVFNLAVKTTIS